VKGVKEVRFRDYGFKVGYLPPGPLNAITDVPGVRVGQASHATDNAPIHRSGVTVVWPHQGNPFRDRVYAGTWILNGYGIMTGRAVIAEWGLLGAPIVLCDTRSIGIGYEASVLHFNRLDSGVGDLDVLMPVVAECDDGFLNDNRADATPIEVFEQALSGASSGPVQEGCVGAGTGTQLFGFKGGVGTASRRVAIGDATYTVGVLVNTNFGSRHQLIVQGVPLGRVLTDNMPRYEKEGSCIGVIATDAPVLPRQLERLAKRLGLGLVRTGSVGNDGSGELFIAFSTAQKIPRQSTNPLETRHIIDGQFWMLGSPIDLLFDAAVEASEEAVYNALFQATTTVGRDGHCLYAIPAESALDLIRQHHDQG
jgi:D-aminopeptidase